MSATLRRTALVVGLVAVAAAGVTACDSSHNAGGTPGTAGVSSTPAAARNTLQVRATDYAYQIGGSPHAGLVAMTFTNNGKYAHEMGVSKLKPGATLAQIKAAIASPNGEDAATALIDSPDAEYPVPSIVGPGLSVEVTGTLAAGHYVVTCFLPGPDGMPHVAMGMLGEFTVSPAAGSDRPPATGGTIALTDTGITLPASFTAGGTFAVKNTGSSEHDFSLVRLNEPGTLQAYFACVNGSFEKSTPVDTCAGTLAGGVEGLDPGATAYLTLHLAPGSYGYVSTAGDGKDFQAGLRGELTIS